MIDVPVELKLSDVLRAHVLSFSRLGGARLWFVAWFISFGMTVLIGVRSLACGELAAAVWLIAGTTLVIGAIPILRVGLRARRRFLSMDEATRRGMYRLTEEGFTWTLGRSPGRRSWTDIAEAVVGRDRILFYETTHAPHVLPLRSLSNEERETLLGHLHKALGDRLRERG